MSNYAGKHKDIFFVDNFTDGIYGFQSGTIGELVNVHSATLCAGRNCVIHNPSDHHMRSWKTNWRADRGLMERICPKHGTGHPDPDDVAYHVSEGRDWMGVHGCCGCCHV